MYICSKRSTNLHAEEVLFKYHSTYGTCVLVVFGIEWHLAVALQSESLILHPYHQKKNSSVLTNVPIDPNLFRLAAKLNHRSFTQIYSTVYFKL